MITTLNSGKWSDCALYGSSWLATDIVPMGSSLPTASCRPWPSHSHGWVIIATAGRLARCEVTGHLIGMRFLRALDGHTANWPSTVRKEIFAGTKVERRTKRRATSRNILLSMGCCAGRAAVFYRGALLPYLLPARMRASE